MSSSERRVIETNTTQWQQVIVAQATTANATPLVVYEAQGTIPENRMLYFDVQCIVGLPNKSRVSTINATAGIARAVGGNIRLVASPNYTVLQGEMKSNEVSIAVVANAGTQKWQIVVTDKTALGLQWVVTLRVTRNTT